MRSCRGAGAAGAALAGAGGFGALGVDDADGGFDAGVFGAGCCIPVAACRCGFCVFDATGVATLRGGATGRAFCAAPAFVARAGSAAPLAVLRGTAAFVDFAVARFAGFTVARLGGFAMARFAGFAAARLAGLAAARLAGAFAACAFLPGALLPDFAGAFAALRSGLRAFFAADLRTAFFAIASSSPVWPRSTRGCTCISLQFARARPPAHDCAMNAAALPPICTGHACGRGNLHDCAFRHARQIVCVQAGGAMAQALLTSARP